MSDGKLVRRTFLGRLAMMGGAAVGGTAVRAHGQGASHGDSSQYSLPEYARAQDYISLKQSSYDRTGGNADAWPVAVGETREVFNAAGPGVITHIWFTIGADSEHHLKEIVLRMYWDGQDKPSVETPVGDFFGLNLGQYNLYQSAFLNCSSAKALNCYFAMPFRKAARITVTNEGKHKVGSFYSNIDYQLVPSLPDRSLYFHAQYRQMTPNKALKYATYKDELNPDGKNNYVFVETRGRGHLMGVTLGVLQNHDNWMGEGDDMIFVDDPAKPVINGTGLEDYFNGAWGFTGGEFANLYCGAHLIVLKDVENSGFPAGTRYCLYRWHADNPVTFRKYLKHTIEHGHANDRADNFYSVAYWYQSEPYTDFPALPPVEERIPALKMDSAG
jgi:hypothetical protein